jgi:preprotein translocase subunit SecE
MTTQDVQTVNSKLDLALVVLAVAVLLAGVLGFSLLSERPLLIRIGILLGGLVIAIGIAWFSESGKRFLAFARDSYEETRRVSWPARK